MSENNNEENTIKSLNENKFDHTLHFINYKSTNLAEGKYKYDSITNKLIENYKRIYDVKMKFTFIFNSEAENILQTEYPKLILNKNTYSNYDIPHILKDITKIDKVDLTILEQKEKETFNREIFDTILKKWLQIENTIFFELEKLFYVFFCLYSSSKKYLMVSCIRNLIKLFYNPNINFYSLYKKHKAMKDYCLLYNIDSAKDCLKKIFAILESIDSFLKEMREKIRMLKNKTEKFAEILKEKIFSYDVTVYAIYLALKEFFIEEDDCLFLKNSLKNFFVIKYDRYQKENEKFNMKDIDDEENDYLGMDYLKHKNKNISDDENHFRFTLRVFFPEIIKTVEYYERIYIYKDSFNKIKLSDESFKNLEDHTQKIYDHESFGTYPETANSSLDRQNGTANKLIFTSVFFGLLFFLKFKYSKIK